MICQNCGEENIVKDAAFCINCNQALNKDGPPGIIEPSNAGDDDSDVDKQNLQDNESGSSDDDLQVADPIDFIMGENLQDEVQPAYPTPVSKEKTERQIRSEPYDLESHGNDLFSPGPVKIAPQKTAVAVSEEKKEPTQPDQARQAEPADREDTTTQEKPIPAVAANAFHEKAAETEETVTQKVVARDEKKEPILSLNVARPQTERQPPSPSRRVTTSKGIVLVSGDKLILTGGTRVFPGDEIFIGEKTYEVRPKPNDRDKLIKFGGGGAALLIVLIILFGGIFGSGDGQLVGTIMSGSGGFPLADQSVRILELNRTVTTNQAGFFIFDGLESGLYTIQQINDGQPVAEEKIAVVGGKITTITLYKGKSSSSVPVESPRQLTQHSENKAPPESRDKYGTLRLTVSPKETATHLDGKPLGKGSDTYRVKPGKYVLSAERKGYETKSRKITVEPGKTLSYDFALARSKKAAPKKTNGELAYENETAGNYHEALRYYDRMLEKNSRDLAAVTGKARCYQAQGLYDQAVTYYTQAARIAADKGDVGGQIDALTSIIDIRPNTFTAYQNRGDLYYARKDYDNAVEDYEKVIQLDRRNLGAYYKLGNSHYYSGDYAGALSAYQAAEEINFADPKAHVYQARTYLMLGDKKNMKKSYEKVAQYASYAARLEFKNDPGWQKVLEELGVDN